MHYKGRPVGSLKTTRRKAQRKAGITRVLRLYDFRHAGLINALRRGADLKSTSEIGGYSRADATMVFYEHTVRDQQRAAFEIVPGVSVPPRARK